MKKLIIVQSKRDLSAYNKIKEECLPVSTDYEATKLLNESSANFVDADRLLSKKDLLKIATITDKIVINVINSALSHTFRYDGLNLLSQLENHLKYYFWRIVESYFIIVKLKSQYKIKEAVIISNNYNNVINTPLDSNFLSLALKIKRIRDKSISVITIKSSKSLNLKKIFFRFLINIRILKDSLLSKDLKTINSANKLILILPQEHALKLIGFFNKLNKNDINYLLVLHNTTAEGSKLLQNSGVNFIDRSRIKRNLKKADSLSLILQKRFSRSSMNVKMVKDKPMNQYLQGALRLKVNSWFESNQIRNLVELNLQAKEIVSKESKLVFTTTDPDYRVVPFVEYANKIGIKTITLQHGAYANENTVNFKSKYLFSWGNYYKEWFVKNLHKRREQIKIVGSPFLKRSKPYRSRGKLRRNVLILTTNAGFKYSSFNVALEGLIRELGKIGVKNIYLRAHRWQKFQFLKENKFGSALKLADKQNLKYYLSRVDIAVTMNTTAGFEALAEGLYVIYWDFLKTRKMPFNQAGLQIESSPQKVVIAVNNILKGKIRFSEEKKQILLKDVFSSVDGQSSQRVIREITSILKEQKNDGKSSRKDKSP